MRRLAAISAFGLLLAVPVWAQHGGGHGGGGHAGSGGHGGGHASVGHSSGSHSSASVHSYSGVTHAPRAGVSHSPYAHNSFRSGTRARIYTYGFRNNGYGRWGYGYPWWGWGYYDPWLWDWWNDDAQFDQDYNDNLARADQMNQQSLEEQRMQEDEQRLWRQEQADGDQDAYAPRQYAPSSPSSGAGAPAAASSPATVLVFRDQRKEEIQNYAVVGTMLWNFAPQHTEKIPLADLDLVATKKANDERGITFEIPQPNSAPTPQRPSAPQPASAPPASST